MESFCTELYAAGNQCGDYKFSVFRNLEDQDGKFSLHTLRIPVEPKYPLALLRDLNIFPSYQRKGHGRLGLRNFHREAYEKGAVCCFLHLGWGFSEQWEEERDWKAEFYDSEGWILIPRSDDEQMLFYRKLPGSL